MRNGGNARMGRFNVEFEIANNADLILERSGHLNADEIRRKTIQGTVDSGATDLILPGSVARELGFPVRKSKTRVRYADGRRALRSEVDEVRLYLMGRDSIFTAIVEPKRDIALIGAIVLEKLDLLVDCRNLRLVPRDPDYVLSEIE